MCDRLYPYAILILLYIIVYKLNFVFATHITHTGRYAGVIGTVNPDAQYAGWAIETPRQHGRQQHRQYRPWLFYGYLLNQGVWINLPQGNQYYGLYHIITGHAPRLGRRDRFNFHPNTPSPPTFPARGGLLLSYAITARNYIAAHGIHNTNAHNLHPVQHGFRVFIRNRLGALGAGSALWKMQANRRGEYNLLIFYNAGHPIGQRGQRIIAFALHYNLTGRQYTLNIISAYPY